MKESQIQKAILDLLAAKRILAFRMNTGAMSGEHNGKKRFMRFGAPGMADILAFAPRKLFSLKGKDYGIDAVVWIECKNAKGKQSELQASFQQMVEAEGHRYILARSVDDVIEAL